MTILEVQEALRRVGFDPGPLDGIAGPRTQAALRADARVTAARAPVGPAEVDAAMPWLAEARRLIGTAEVPGPLSAPEIMSWAEGAGIDYAADEVPWCGLFVAHCMSASLPDEPLPAQPLGARQWLKFGRPAQPQVGAVLVFWRGSPEGWTGHVGFCWAEEADYFHVLGGNQSDAVTITRIARTRLLGARWPSGVAPAGLVHLAASGKVAVSQSES